MQCLRIESTLATISASLKRQVRARYRAQVDRCSPLNQQRRACLSEALFAVENDLEHRQPRHPQVRVLRAVRNALYDDLGWNEHADHSTEALLAEMDLTVWDEFH